MLYFKFGLIRSKLILLIQILLIFSVSFSQSYTQSYSCDNTGLTKEVEKLRIFIARNLNQKSIVLADSLLDIFDQRNLNECEEALWTLHHKGDAYELEQDLTRSISYYNKIIPLALKNQYWDLLADTYISLGRSHEMAGRGMDCKRNMDEAFRLITDHNLERTLARLSCRASSYYRIYENNIDTALVLAEQAVILGKKHKHMRAISDGYLLMGMMTTDPKERLQHFINGRDTNFELEAYHAAITFNCSVAGIQLELGDIDLAEKTVRKSFVYDRKLKEEAGNLGYYNYYGKSRTHYILSQIYEKRGRQDSVKYHIAKAKEFSKMLEIQQDQKEISQQEIKNAVDVEKIKAQAIEDKLKISRIAMGISLLALFLLAGLIYLLFKNRNELRSKNELISEQMDELSKLSTKQGMLLSEVHHRVKNNLQNVISLLTLQEQRIKDPNAKLKINDVSNKIYSIALIHEQLYREGDFEFIDIHQYFTDLLEHYKSLSADSSKSFNYTIDTNALKLNLETVIPLGIICSEVINNSLKYGDSEKSLTLKIVTDQIDKSIYKFIYSDNGNGYPQDVINNKSSGMGMILLKSMSRQLNGNIDIYNNNGAVTELTFKQKEVSKI